mgnify:CR=1 FL=1
MFQSGPVGVVMQDQRAIFRSDGATKGWCFHPGIQSSQMIVQSIQILG